MADENPMITTVSDLIFRAVKAYEGLPALTFREGKSWQTISYGGLWQRASFLARKFEERKLSPRERVAIYIDSGPNWLIADLAAQIAGLVTVPRGISAPEEELAFLLDHSQAMAVVVEPQGLSKLEKVLSLVARDPEVFVVENLGQDEFRKPEALPDDLATIVYTSGTTGNPKGVMLTQANIASNVLACQTVLRPRPGKRYLSLLMPYHMLERTVEYLLLSSGVEIIFSDKRHFREDLRRHRPHYLVGVPRLWEAFYQRINQEVASRGLEAWFKRALRVGLLFRRSLKMIRGETAAVGPMARLKHLLGGLGGGLIFFLPWLLAEAVFFRRLRGVFGGSVEMAISGGSTLAPELDDFYEAIGMPLFNGYGLTETSPVISVRYKGRNLPGTVGPPLPGTEIRIEPPEKGEVLVRGPQVMKGYWQNPSATAAIFTDDGFLKTGDLGCFTPRGDLIICGRLKDVIVLSSGENVDPDPIEALLFESPFISQVMLVGQDRKFLGALVVPDRERLLEWARQRGLDLSWPDLCRSPEARDFIHQEIKAILSRARVHPFEHVGAIRLIPEDWTLENGLLTFTLKKRRALISKRYAHEIEEMYS